MATDRLHRLRSVPTGTQRAHILVEVHAPHERSEYDSVRNPGARESVPVIPAVFVDANTRPRWNGVWWVSRMKQTNKINSPYQTRRHLLSLHETSGVSA